MLTERGIPVCAHLGLTPQSVNKFDGFRVQGRSAEDADKIHADALMLAEAGADLLVLECVPSALAKRITADLPIPTRSEERRVGRERCSRVSRDSPKNETVGGRI